MPPRSCSSKQILSAVVCIAHSYFLTSHVWAICLVILETLEGWVILSSHMTDDRIEIRRGGDLLKLVWAITKAGLSIQIANFPHCSSVSDFGWGQDGRSEANKKTLQSNHQARVGSQALLIVSYATLAGFLSPLTSNYCWGLFEHFIAHKILAWLNEIMLD